MDEKESLKHDLNRIKGLTVAIVYFFEGDNAPGLEHYHVWGSDVISGWLNAVQLLGCRPFILDVRTFAEKAFSNTLPHIDFVVNLNCGSKELSPMSIVPSACAFLGIPCIPCDCTAILTGENKLLSNIIAQACQLTIPKNIPNNIDTGIFRPLNFGSSLGVERGKPSGQIDGVYQQFIYGFDITTPAVYNPILKEFSFLPTILYVPDSKDLSWYFGENQKESKRGYNREIIHGLEHSLKIKYLDLMKKLNVQTFCRIDARIAAKDFDEINEIKNATLSERNLYFIEINTMPTVNTQNSFGYSYNAITSIDDCAQYDNVLKELYGNVSVHSFVLASAMLLFFKAKH